MERIVVDIFGFGLCCLVGGAIAGMALTGALPVDIVVGAGMLICWGGSQIKNTYYNEPKS